MNFQELRKEEGLRIIDFNHSHIPMASEIARDCYELERLQIPILPKIKSMPELTHFADNQLGVAAFEGNRLIGYLCAYSPREDIFGTTMVRGTFTPIHAHGVISDSSYNRDRIYSLLYQEAAKKWVMKGIRSHGIALYTQDKEAINSFFYNGFGLRCIDAIRSLDDIPSEMTIATTHLEEVEFEYCVVPRNEWGLLLKYHNALITHLGISPTFMCFECIDEEELYRRTGEDTRYYAVRLKDNYIAYVKVSTEGENFVTEFNAMMNISGAYCDPKYRSTGIYHNLLTYLMKSLKSEGYQLLGVDCESFNPTARGFWLKYFTEYTHSVVRRIDDKAICIG